MAGFAVDIDETDPVLDLPESPDFDTHPSTVGAVTVVAEKDGIAVSWSDGSKSHFNRFWLRENVVTQDVINPVTRERDLDVSQLPEELAVASAAIDGTGSIVLTWHPDGCVTRHHPGWLRAFYQGRWRPQAWLPDQIFWDAEMLPEPLSFHGPSVLESDGALHEWLTALHRYGLARLRGLSDEAGLVQRVAERIGTVRPSNFGFIFDVESKPQPDSNAYTASALTPHTDLPTRETQPGLQLLHCRVNNCQGGFSVMVDGFKVAEDIRAADADAFNALASLRWLFSNRHRASDYRWSGPIIQLGQDGRVIETRFANSLRAEPDMEADEIERGYRALRLYLQYLASSKYRCRYPFAVGDLVVFDNRRILHGREAFDANEGARQLQGCYMDRDELYCRLRILARHARAGGPQIV